MKTNELGLTIRPQGYFIIRTDKRGVLAEFSNLITDTGLDLLVYDNYMHKCFVGTGNVAPTVNDIQMGFFVAENREMASSTSGCATSPPYYAYTRNVYRFAAGSAAGNLSEVGIGRSVPGSRSLFSRELIKDSFGNPTTITLLSDEVLEVVYELRHFIPENDSTGSVTFTGNLAGTYAYTLRALQVTSSSIWISNGKSYTNHYQTGASAYASVIGSITGVPTGNHYPCESAILSSYVSGTYTAQITYRWGLTRGNVPGGIKSIIFHLGIGAYQVEFNPPIPKTDLNTLQLTFVYSWARKP